MPTLLLQFKQLLAESASFKILTGEKQADLMRNFEDATDEQLGLAIAAIEKNNAEVAAREERLVAAAQALKTELAKVKKEELKDDEAKESVDSEQVAAKLLASLGQKDAATKRKKFLGIF